MKIQKSLLASLLVLVASFSSPVAKANLITNGDFEGQAFATYAVDTQGFGAWVVLGNIDPFDGPASVTVFPPGVGGPLSDHLDLGGFTDRIGKGSSKPSPRPTASNTCCNSTTGRVAPTCPAA